MTLALAMVTVAALGAVNSLVAALNGVVGRRLGPWRATFVFMSAGTLVAGAFVLVFERRVLDLEVLRSLPPYALVPGLLNTLMIVTVVRVVSVIGTMQTTASIFCGSVVVSLVLDHIGAFGLPSFAGSPTRIAGAALLVVGVAITTLAQRRHEPDVLTHAAPHAFTQTFTRTLPSVLAAFTVGAVDNVSMAINASVARDAGPFAATVAFLLPGVVMLALALRRRRPTRAELRPSDAIPGVWNVLGLAASMVVVPIVGLHLANGTRFAAAIVTGVLADHLGVFGAVRIPLSRGRALAALLLVAGVALSLA